MLWSEIPPVWTYTTHDVTAVSVHSLFSLGGIPHRLVDLPDLQQTGPSTSKTPTVNVGGILLSKKSPWKKHCCTETLILGRWHILENVLSC